MRWSANAVVASTGLIARGLRIDEAMHPLTILATGLYDKPMPNQNGAPIRLVVPWKYGFKSIKSVVKITLTDRQPQTSWEMLQPSEYGFYANVNPTVDHPGGASVRAPHRRGPAGRARGNADVQRLRRSGGQPVCGHGSGEELLMQRVNGYLRRIPEWAVWLAGALPLALLAYDTLTGGLGVDPIRDIEHRLGRTALYFDRQSDDHARAQVVQGSMPRICAARLGCWPSAMPCCTCWSGWSLICPQLH